MRMNIEITDEIESAFIGAAYGSDDQVVGSVVAGLEAAAPLIAAQVLREVLAERAGQLHANAVDRVAKRMGIEL
jgi:hypothetical protein